MLIALLVTLQTPALWLWVEGEKAATPVESCFLLFYIPFNEYIVPVVDSSFSSTSLLSLLAPDKLWSGAEI